MSNATLWAGLHGACAVACGAFGAHSLKAKLMAHDVHGGWMTASQYQMVHAAVMLALDSQMQSKSSSDKKNASVCFNVGTACFSLSIYLLCLLKINNVKPPFGLGIVTPVGGLIIIAGWLAVVKSAL